MITKEVAIRIVFVKVHKYQPCKQHTKHFEPFAKHECLWAAAVTGMCEVVGFSPLAVTLCVFWSAEKELNTKCVVEMVKNQTILHPAGTNLGKGDSR